MEEPLGLSEPHPGKEDLGQLIRRVESAATGYAVSRGHHYYYSCFTVQEPGLRKAHLGRPHHLELHRVGTWASH